MLHVFRELINFLVLIQHERSWPRSVSDFQKRTMDISNRLIPYINYYYHSINTTDLVVAAVEDVVDLRSPQWTSAYWMTSAAKVPPPSTPPVATEEMVC